MPDPNWLPIGSFSNPDDGSQIDVFWDPSNEQLVLSGIGHEEKLEPVGTLDESLQALAELGINLS